MQSTRAHLHAALLLLVKNDRSLDGWAGHAWQRAVQCMRCSPGRHFRCQFGGSQPALLQIVVSQSQSNAMQCKSEKRIPKDDHVTPASAVVSPFPCSSPAAPACFLPVVAAAASAVIRVPPSLGPQAPRLPQLALGIRYLQSLSLSLC